MGGCASKPKDLDMTTEKAPIEAPSADAPAVAEAPAVPDKPEAVEETKENGDEEKEEPLVDLSEPALAKVEEAKEEAETKPVEEAKEEKKVVA